MLIYILQLFVLLASAIAYPSPTEHLERLTTNSEVKYDIWTRHLSDYGWEVGDWERCTQCCGGGFQYRLVICVYYPDPSWLAGDTWCKKLHVPKPITTRRCNEEPCNSTEISREKRNDFNPRWQVTEWSECSKACGSGRQTREVVCLLDNEAIEFVIPEKLCEDKSQIKPKVDRVCNDNVCFTDKITKRESDHEHDADFKPFWETYEWGQCSVCCGGGYQTRVVKCGYIERDGKDYALQDHWCTNLNIFKPETNRTCNENICQNGQSKYRKRETDFNENLHWLVTNWGDCTEECGGGIQFGEYQCAYDTPHFTYIIPNGLCEDSSIEIPMNEKDCNLVSCEDFSDEDRRKKRTIQENFDWEVTNWTSCSSKCGGGLQEGEYQCYYSTIDDIFMVSNNVCEEHNIPKPPRKKLCNTQVCPQDDKLVKKRDIDFNENLHWLVTNWGDCTEECGGGIQFGEYQCVYDTPHFTYIIPNGLCEDSSIEIPMNERDCNLVSCEDFSDEDRRKKRTIQENFDWEVTNWTSCSSKCGGGVQEGEYQCYYSTIDDIFMVSNNVCEEHNIPKPPRKKSCNTQACPQDEEERKKIELHENFDWEVVNWTSCSKECGGGIQTGEYQCYYATIDDNYVVDNDVCEEHKTPKPPRKKSCNSNPCRQDEEERKKIELLENFDWEVKNWTSCSKECGGGIQTGEYQCYYSTIDDNYVVDNDVCEEHKIPKPPRKKSCNTNQCRQDDKLVKKRDIRKNLGWQVTDWSECSKKCDAGFQTREYQCAYTTYDDIILVSNSICMEENLTIPTLRKACNRQPCLTAALINGTNVPEEIDWAVTNWGACSKECGGGLQTGQYVCVYQTKEYLFVYPAIICKRSNRKKPINVTTCNDNPCEIVEINYSDQTN